MAGKRLKIGGGGGGWSQVLDGILVGLGVIEEIKSPCCCRDWGWRNSLVVVSLQDRLL